METVMSSPWALVTLVGVIILGLAMWYGSQRNKTRTRGERATTEAATRSQYKREDN